jgi:hypothetical protein
MQLRISSRAPLKLSLLEWGFLTDTRNPRVNLPPFSSEVNFNPFGIQTTHYRPTTVLENLRQVGIS